MRGPLWDCAGAGGGGSYDDADDDGRDPPGPSGRGSVGGPEPLGRYRFHSHKSARAAASAAATSVAAGTVAPPGAGACVAQLFVMAAAEELAEWPERGERGRRWCSPQDAHDLLRHPWMKQALRDWHARLPLLFPGGRAGDGGGGGLDGVTWADGPRPDPDGPPPRPAERQS